MSSHLVSAGILLLFVAIVLIIIGFASSSKEGKFAVVGFIGPLPFGFGNDPRALQIALIAGAVIVIILAIFMLRFT